MRRPSDEQMEQVNAMMDRAEELWGEAFTTQVTAYTDGTLVCEVHHKTGETDDGRSMFEELLWHSGRAEPGQAYRRRAVSRDPSAARNNTYQDEGDGGWVEL
jgi:hypothetical protein